MVLRVLSPNKSVSIAASTARTHNCLTHIPTGIKTASSWPSPTATRRPLEVWLLALSVIAVRFLHARVCINSLAFYPVDLRELIKLKGQEDFAPRGTKGLRG